MKRLLVITDHFSTAHGVMSRAWAETGHELCKPKNWRYIPVPSSHILDGSCRHHIVFVHSTAGYRRDFREIMSLLEHLQIPTYHNLTNALAAYDKEEN